MLLINNIEKNGLAICFHYFLNLDLTFYDTAIQLFAS